MAVVTAIRWCRNARTRAALSASDTVGDRRVFRFTIKSFLFFQFYVALALGLIRWIGGPVVPAVAGIAGAAVGFWLTLFLARRRVFDVVILRLLGIAIAGGAILPRYSHGWAPPGERTFEEMQIWFFLTMAVIVPLVGFVARWRLRK